MCLGFHSLEQMGTVGICSNCSCNNNAASDICRVPKVSELKQFQPTSAEFEAIRIKVQEAAKHDAASREGTALRDREVNEGHDENRSDKAPIPFRKLSFDVVLNRVGAQWRNLGVNVSPDDHPDRLVIDDVLRPSLVHEWNRTHDASVQVLPGDQIVAVNGSTCSSHEMLRVIQSCGFGTTVTFHIKAAKKIYKV